MTTNRTTSAGVVTSILASVLFGAIFLVSGAIEAQASTLVAWRVLLTAACYALLLSFPTGQRAFKAFWDVLRKGPLYVFYFVLLVALIALQLWLFAWSPKGHALDASLGYLLLPIFLVAVGRFFFSSIISRLQWIAVGIAIVAVTILLSARRFLGLLSPSRSAKHSISRCAATPVLIAPFAMAPKPSCSARLP